MKPNKLVSEIMTPAADLVTVKMEEPIVGIKNIFVKYNFHHLPVLDDRNKLVGIISQSDFLFSRFLMSYKATGKTEVSFESNYLCAKDIMTKYPLCIDPYDTIGMAADIFLANKFHALPVLDDGMLMGIVTSHDLLEYAYKSPLELKNDQMFEQVQ